MSDAREQASPPQATFAAETRASGRRSEPETSRSGSELRLVWIYPDLLSTYGDRGNVLMLERRARQRGIGVETTYVHSDQPVPTSGDIYTMGGGEDRPQMLAGRRLRADGGLGRAVDAGAAVFAVCAGYQLLGSQFGGDEGQPCQGLELLDMTSSRLESRAVGEIAGDVDGELGVPALTGFENHQGGTRLGEGVRPLARTTVGIGNGDGFEGAWKDRLVGTYLHGPALVRNPALADLLLGWIVGELPPVEGGEDWPQRLRDERFAALSQQVAAEQ